MKHLWEVGIRSMCSTWNVITAIRGTHQSGWDVDYILARYRSHYGKSLKRETLYRLYEKYQIESRDPNRQGKSIGVLHFPVKG